VTPGRDGVKASHPQLEPRCNSWANSWLPTEAKGALEPGSGDFQPCG
jgi:hypothetical protein